jgi:hypothetical protein
MRYILSNAACHQRVCVAMTLVTPFFLIDVRSVPHWCGLEIICIQQQAGKSR